MEPLSAVLADAGRAGVYRITQDAEEIARAAQAAGLACFRIDLREVGGKDDFLGLVSESMRFPDWFGHNWDALADCLEDLSWLGGEGVVLVLENAGRLAEDARQEFAQAMELMAEAAEFWRGRGKPFWALIAGTIGRDPGYALPSFPTPG